MTLFIRQLVWFFCAALLPLAAQAQPLRYSLDKSFLLNAPEALTVNELPQQAFLHRLQAFDGPRYGGIMQTIETMLGVDRSTAEARLWSASHNIVEIPGLFWWLVTFVACAMCYLTRLTPNP